MAEIAKLTVEAETKDLKEAKKDLDALVPAAKAVETSTDRVTDSFNDAGRATKTATSRFAKMASSFQVQKNAVQQASFQIQDFAVQVGAGTSAVTAFSQQAPQLLGVLGAGGALLGGVVAVTAAIGGPFLMSLLDSKDASEELEEALDTLKDTVKITKDGTVLLSEEFSILAAKSREVAEVQLKARLVTAAAATNAAFSQLKETVEEFNLDLDKSGNAARGNANRINRLAKEYGITSQQVKELKQLQATVFETKTVEDAEKLTAALTAIALSGDKVTDKFVTLVSDSNKLAAELRTTKDISDQLKDSLGNLDKELETGSVTGIKAAEARGKAEAKALAEAERNAERNRKLKEREAEDRARLALQIENEEIRLTEMFRREDEKRIAIQQQTAQITMAQDQMVIASKLDFVGQVGAALQQGAEEGSTAAKIGYATVQAVQVAQAINSANVAAAGQLAAYAGIPDPTGALLAAAQARSATIRGVGYATAGLIAGQTIGTLAGGRALGGQVRPGESYRVGEYGPETITMGSSGGFVTPKASANDSQVNLVTNVKVIGGSGNAEVTNTVSKKGDNKWVQDIIVTEMGNPTSKSRQALQNSSNVTATGTR